MICNLILPKCITIFFILSHFGGIKDHSIGSKMPIEFSILPGFKDMRALLEEIFASKMDNYLEKLESAEFQVL